MDQSQEHTGESEGIHEAEEGLNRVKLRLFFGIIGCRTRIVEKKDGRDKWYYNGEIAGQMELTHSVTGRMVDDDLMESFIESESKWRDMIMNVHGMESSTARVWWWVSGKEIKSERDGFNGRKSENAAAVESCYLKQ